MVIPVILAGGSGTRLWPLSRELHPKQLLGLIDESTMLQNTVLRLTGFDGVASPIVICNENHRFMVAEQLRSIGVEPLAIMLEPVGRNTAPALAAAAFKALETEENPTLLVLPADHTIQFAEKLHDAMAQGVSLAATGRLITFGIEPASPETGYGYIRKGAPVDGGSAVMIDRFVEKPDLETAQAYLNSGDYCWNSGMFMFGAREVLDELERFTPDIVTSCRIAVERGREDLDFFRLDHDAFSACQEDSIDYAVMEKTDKGVMVALSAGWNDVGSWDAIWQIGEKNEAGNVVKGDVFTHDVSSSLLQAESRMIAAIGIQDMIVVETKDAVLVAPRNRGQDVKRIVAQLKAKDRYEAMMNTVVYRPWGSYEGIDLSDRFQVKRITVNPGAELSLQKHFHRAEHWVVVRGTALVTRGEETILLREDESTYISLGTVHRLENPGKIPLELIEVQSGSYLGEDDIVRLDDNYGR